MLNNKNIQNPAVMAELIELLCCPSSLAPASKLSRTNERGSNEGRKTADLSRGVFKVFFHIRSLNYMINYMAITCYTLN